MILTMQAIKKISLAFMLSFSVKIYSEMNLPWYASFIGLTWIILFTLKIVLNVNNVCSKLLNLIIIWNSQTSGQTQSVIGSCFREIKQTPYIWRIYSSGQFSWWLIYFSVWNYFFCAWKKYRLFPSGKIPDELKLCLSFTDANHTLQLNDNTFLIAWSHHFASKSQPK